MNFKGKAKRIEDIDLPLIGREIGVGEDEVHAVLDVESAGSGFDKQGRPKMLFEPHIFWKELGPGTARDKAAAQGLAYPRWKPGAYPKDSYPRLAKAMAIDAEKALRSASWGLGQIMGFNCRMAGFDTARAMVEAFIDDEDQHLRAMISFIRAAGLDDELRRHAWNGFARGYNGPGFAKNGYDRKLAQAFARWQKIKDTPVPANPTKVASPPPVARKPARKLDVDAEAPKRPGQSKSAAKREPAIRLQQPRGVFPLVLGMMVGGYAAVAAWWNENLQPVIDWLVFWQ